MIAFIGSVFSPYYRRARMRGHADPFNHCAINAVLYGPRGKRWAMTERGATRLERSATHFRIGRSQLTFAGDVLTISLDERCCPVPWPLRGTIRIQPHVVAHHTYDIHRNGRHQWRPIAPMADISVSMEKPDLRWSGHGYCDHNRGSAPLEQDFAQWTWARLATRHGSAILYDTLQTDGDSVQLAIAHARDGHIGTIETPDFVPLPPTGWRIARQTRSEDAASTTARTLEDTPFYARSAITARLNGERVKGMHESLSLTRFASPLVQAMLPFRMPRRA